MDERTGGMAFDTYLQINGYPRLAAIAWFLRHPWYATHWWLTGKPWSA